MSKFAIAAGALALAITGPAMAKPGHAKGHGNHGKHSQHAMGWGAGGCPPGLAKKNNGCMPPGQAKKLYNIGQRFPTVAALATNLHVAESVEANLQAAPRKFFVVYDQRLNHLRPRTEY